MAPRWGRVAGFYGATFVLTHGLSVAFVAAGGSWQGPSSFAVANVLMLCPAAVALAAQRFVVREPVREALGPRLGSARRWWVFAWLFPPGVMLAALAVSILAPGAAFAADMRGLPAPMEPFRLTILSLGFAPLGAMVLVGLALGPTLNAIGGLGEELGWRGFLFRELAPLGFWRCSLVTGALWALWHVPAVLEGYGDPEHPVASALGVVAFALLLAPILHLVRLRTGSVLACAVLHGTMSSTRLVSVAFVRGAGPWAEAAIPVVLLACDVVVLVAGVGRATTAPSATLG